MSQGFLLDTNIISEQVRSVPEPLVSRWLAAQSRDTLSLSVITMGEIRRGIALLPPSKRRSIFEHWLENDVRVRFSGKILPVTHAVAESWGALAAKRQIAGSPLALADGLIAATALEQNLILVTRNTKHFLGLGVSLLNPWHSHPEEI